MKLSTSDYDFFIMVKQLLGVQGANPFDSAFLDIGEKSSCQFDIFNST